MDNKFHHQKSCFNSDEEWGKASLQLTRSEILEKVQNIPRNQGELKKCKKNDDRIKGWKKKYILFDLLYWKVQYAIS